MHIKFPLYFISLKWSLVDKNDKVKLSLSPQINTIWSKYSSSILMMQVIVNKACLPFWHGEEGIQLDFPLAVWVPSVFTTFSVRDIPVPSVTHVGHMSSHSKLNTLSKDFIWNKTDGKDWRRSRRLLYTKLKCNNKQQMWPRPRFPEIQKTGLKFRVLKFTNARTEFQYLRHYTEKLPYRKIHQNVSSVLYYKWLKWNHFP